MDPTRPDNNQVSQQPTVSGSVAVAGTKEAPITINTTNPVPERPAGVESSYPEIHETAGGFIKPNISAQPPIAEIQTQLEKLGTQPLSVASHLSITPARAHELAEREPVGSGGKWLGTLVEKINKIAEIFRKKQPIGQP